MVEDFNKNLSIIIVDDDPAIRHVCSTILKKTYDKVETFDDGNKALNYIKENDVDIALIDLKMPNISGHELIEKSG